MKSFIMLGVLLSASIWAMSVPEDTVDGKDVQKIYDKIVRANPGVRRVPIYVKEGVYTWCSEACNMGNEIIVSKEAFEVIKNEDELAGIIGHEEAHFVYRDEMKADILGLQYAAKAGYDRCTAAQLLKGYRADKVHPSGATRYANTGCP